MSLSAERGRRRGRGRSDVRPWVFQLRAHCTGTVGNLPQDKLWDAALVATTHDEAWTNDNHMLFGVSPMMSESRVGQGACLEANGSNGIFQITLQFSVAHHRGTVRAG